MYGFNEKMLKLPGSINLMSEVCSLILLTILFCPGCNAQVSGKKDRAVIDSFSSINPVEQNQPVISTGQSSSGPVNPDTTLYKTILLHLVHGKPSDKWPVISDFPQAGAILPFKRIVAYYGNFYTEKMGILGEVPADTMLKHLEQEVTSWQKADTLLPVQPALQYIAVTAQAKPGKNSKYRLRMPFNQVDKAIALATKINAIVILDIQVGWSSLKDEIPYWEPYLRMPNVHLAIDPEYSMKGGQVPCAEIGTFDAADVNYAVQYLSDLVKKNQLTPKVLVIHRFTKGMVTNYKKIKLMPEVQIVMDMDGFGFPAKKVDSYNGAIAGEPVQFTGFKLFYLNDILSYPHIMMKPSEVLKLYPSPVYIQYQ